MELKDQLQVHLNEIDKKARQIAQIQQLEAKTGVRPSYMLVGVGALFILFVLFGAGANALCNLVGFAYPVYAGFKAIKSPNKDDDAAWLTYFVVYGFFGLIESFTDFFLYWIPFYYLAKMIFLLWLYLPQTKGAEFVFKKAIDPILSKYEKQIDAGLEKARLAGDSVASIGRKKIGEVTETEQQPKKTM